MVVNIYLLIIIDQVHLIFLFTSHAFVLMSNFKLVIHVEHSEIFTYGRHTLRMSTVIADLSCIVGGDYTPPNFDGG